MAEHCGLCRLIVSIEVLVEYVLLCFTAPARWSDEVVLRSQTQIARAAARTTNRDSPALRSNTVLIHSFFCGSASKTEEKFDL